MSHSLCHLAATRVGNVLLLPAVAGILHLASLVIRGLETILASLCVDLRSIEVRKLLGSGDIAHLLEVALGEDEINLLKGSPGGLRIEEIDDGEEEGVQNCEEKVCTPTDAVNEHGSDHNNEEVPAPVRDGGQGVCLGTSLQRVDLSRVQPGQREPGGTEEGDVGEETNSGTLGRVRIARDQACEDKNHGQALAYSTPEEELAASDTLNEEPGGGGENGVDNHVDTSEQERQVLGSTDGVTEEDREVVDDGVATRKLLHELRSSSEKHTTEMLSLATSEENRDRSRLAEAASHLNGVENNAGLKLNLSIVNGLGLEGCQNDSGFILSIVRKQPSRRLGQSCGNTENDESEEALEGDGETPDQVVRSVCAAVVDPVSNKRADSDVASLNADDLASVVGLGALGLVGRDGRCVDTVSELRMNQY